MAKPKPTRTPTTRLARRMPSSSGARVALPRFTPCVLGLLGQARPRAHADLRSTDLASRAVSAIEAIVLGLVQGLTEFLPISSSGHLRIVPAMLGWEDPGAAFTAVIQLGTMAAVLALLPPRPVAHRPSPGCAS